MYISNATPLINGQPRATKYLNARHVHVATWWIHKRPDSMHQSQLKWLPYTARSRNGAVFTMNEMF